MGSKKIMNSAKTAALLDRASLLEACANVEDMRNDIIKEIEAFETWEYKPLKHWTKEDIQTGYRILVFAEQYENSVADAQSKNKEIYDEAIKAASTYRKFRQENFGKSTLEKRMEEAVQIPMTLENLKAMKPNHPRSQKL